MGSRPPKAQRRRPRLLIATPDFPPERGGIQVMAERLATGIDGFDTRVVALDSPGGAGFDREHALDVRRVRHVGSAGAVRNVSLNVAAMAEAARLRPHAALSMHTVASPAVAAMRRLLGSRTAQIFHAEEITARPKLAAFAARQACASIAVSRYTAGLIAETGAVPPRLELIPPGVDLARERSSIPSERPVVVTVARLEERYKGHDVMVRAMALVLAKVPEAQWIVVGEGSLQPALEQLVNAYGLSDSVRFLGAVADEQRDLWLRRASVLAMPSRLPAGGLAGEGFGIAYLEAAAFGKPVVAGNVGGAVDAVLDGETGLLVDPRDPLAVADAITRLLLDPELARRLGGAGAERAQRLAWAVFVHGVERVLLELLASTGATALGAARDRAQGTPS